MTGFSVNYQKDIVETGANTGNITYVVYGTLGKAFGHALNLDPNTSLMIGKIFTRAICLVWFNGNDGCLLRIAIFTN